MKGFGFRFGDFYGVIELLLSMPEAYGVYNLTTSDDHITNFVRDCKIFTLLLSENASDFTKRICLR